MRLKKMKPHKSFNTVLKKSHTQPVLVQFYADWCGPCRTLKPILQDLARKEADKWSFVSIDVEQNQQVAASYQIVSIPTVHLFYEGESLASFRGVKSESTILNWLDTNLPKKKKKKKTKTKKKERSSKYKDAEKSLQQGNIPLATIQLLGALHEEQPEESIVKILLALQFLGKNNPQATQLLMEMDQKGELKAIAKQLQSLIDLEVDEQDEHLSLIHI